MSGNTFRCAVRVFAFALLPLVAVQTAAFAETIEGRVSQAGSRAVSVVVYDAQGRPYANALNLSVDSYTVLNGVSSAAALRPNDPVSADVSQRENGQWHADRITLFQDIHARPVTPKPSPSLRDVLGNPVVRGALTGAATGAIAASASGGKAGKGALVGAGVGAAAGLLQGLFSQQPSNSQSTSSDQQQ